MKVRVRKIDELKTQEARALAVELLKGRRKLNVEVYVADRKRGFAETLEDGTRVVVVPLWATTAPGLFSYYLAHELAHHYASCFDGSDVHCRAFMKWFKRICPADLWHHELDYNPREAEAAGIAYN